MGLLRDLFMGTSPKEDKPEAEPDNNEQDWRVEEQARWADKPMDDWGTEKNEAEPDKVDDPYRDDAGNKIRPEVAIERVKVNLNSDMKRVEIWGFIKNRSEFDVEVSRVNLLGQRTELGHSLGAGESREVRIYNGNTPTSDAYHTAEVQFKIVGSGDYFQADHFIKYRYEQNDSGKYYVPSEFDLTRPIKDV